MQRSAVALLLLCAGCEFRVGANPSFVSPSDLAVAGAGDDAGTVAPLDLAVADLLPPSPPDLVVDPCAGAPPLTPGAVGAQCVIGNPPTIDGNLADWPLGSFVAMTKTSSAQANGTWDVTGIPNDVNSSARFFVRWDLSYLYVAASIGDDVRNTPNTAPNLTDNDAIEIFVDGQHDRTQSYGADDWQLVYSADGQKAAGQVTVVNWPGGTHEAWGGTSPAWTLEAAIPWSVLGGSAAAPGRIVGFDLKLDDNDGGSLRERDLVLYYDAPSGGQCQAPYCRTDAFGAVQLGGR